MLTSVKDLISEIANKTGMKKKDVSIVYDAFVDTIIKYASSKDDTKVAIPGIGMLKISVREAYTAKNPRTGETVAVPASKRAYLKVAPKFIKSINE